MSDLEPRLDAIVSIAKGMLDGCVPLELGCNRIIEFAEIAEKARKKWQCRFCGEWFSSYVPREWDCFGSECLSCATRTKLILDRTRFVLPPSLREKQKEFEKEGKDDF